ncbi:MAG: hypothetical protein ACFCUM_13340 [Bacteroidales bacterium]
MNPKIIHLLELVWISLAILSFLAGIYNWYQTGFNDSMMFFVITILSFMMFLYRRNLRKSQKP